MPRISTKESQKKFATILISIITLLLLAFGVWYLVDKSKQIENAPIPEIVSDQRN